MRLLALSIFTLILTLDTACATPEDLELFKGEIKKRQTCANQENEDICPGLSDAFKENVVKQSHAIPPLSGIMVLIENIPARTGKNINEVADSISWLINTELNLRQFNKKLKKGEAGLSESAVVGYAVYSVLSRITSETLDENPVHQMVNSIERLEKIRIPLFVVSTILQGAYLYSWWNNSSSSKN